MTGINSANEAPEKPGFEANGSTAGIEEIVVGLLEEFNL